MSENYKFTSQSSYQEFSQDSSGRQHKRGYNVRVNDVNGNRKVIGKYYRDDNEYVITDVVSEGNDIKYIVRDKDDNEYVIDRDILAKKLLE